MAMTHDPVTNMMYESDFARLFNPENKHWDPTLLSNMLFIEIQESYLNELLAGRGHLFLNELYDALGFPRVPSGQLVGWLHSDGRPIRLRKTLNDDGSIMVEPNVIKGDVMYCKI